VVFGFENIPSGNPVRVSQRHEAGSDILINKKAMEKHFFRTKGKLNASVVSQSLSTKSEANFISLFLLFFSEIFFTGFCSVECVTQYVLTANNQGDQIGRLLTLDTFFITEVAQNVVLLFPKYRLCTG
jgi:Tfp pilus assembly protein PilE